MAILAAHRAARWVHAALLRVAAGPGSSVAPVSRRFAARMRKVDRYSRSLGRSGQRCARRIRPLARPCSRSVRPRPCRQSLGVARRTPDHSQPQAARTGQTRLNVKALSLCIARSRHRRPTAITPVSPGVCRRLQIPKTPSPGRIDRGRHIYTNGRSPAELANSGSSGRAALRVENSRLTTPPKCPIVALSRPNRPKPVLLWHSQVAGATFRPLPLVPAVGAPYASFTGRLSFLGQRQFRLCECDATRRCVLCGQRFGGDTPARRLASRRSRRRLRDTARACPSRLPQPLGPANDQPVQRGGDHRDRHAAGV